MDRPLIDPPAQPAVTALAGLAALPAGPVPLLLSLGPDLAVASWLCARAEPGGVPRRVPLTLLAPEGVAAVLLEPASAVPGNGRLWRCMLVWREPLPCVLPSAAVLGRWLGGRLQGVGTAARGGRLARAVLALVGDAASAAPPPTTGLGVGLRQLQRDFRQGLGLSPSDCLRLLQVQRAAVLVLGGTPLAAVAAGCGFADQPHMTRTFLRVAGVTPGGLRAAAAVPACAARRRG